MKSGELVKAIGIVKKYNLDINKIKHFIYLGHDIIESIDYDGNMGCHHMVPEPSDGMWRCENCPFLFEVLLDRGYTYPLLPRLCMKLTLYEEIRKSEKFGNDVTQYRQELKKRLHEINYALLKVFGSNEGISLWK